MQSSIHHRIFIAPFLQRLVVKHLSQNNNHIAKRRKRQRINSSSSPPTMLSREWLRKPEAEIREPCYKLLSYNVLAQDLLIEHMNMYSGISKKLLLWQHRLNCLRAEIVQLQPDILCLQEVQYNHMKELYAALQGNHYFEYIYKKRSGCRTDGCAILYDRSKFRLMAERPLEYYTPGNPTLNRENVAVLVRLQVRNEPQTEFIVATTHLLYNPRREDVRTAQVNVLMRTLLEFSLLQQGQVRLPVVLTGDFNFTVNSSSFRVLTAPINQTQNPSDSFQLLPIDFGEGCASTHQDDWVTVDHIFYSAAPANRKNFNILGIYRLPTISNLEQHGILPSAVQGSDHLPLVITFTIL